MCIKNIKGQGKGKKEILGCFVCLTMMCSSPSYVDEHIFRSKSLKMDRALHDALSIIKGTLEANMVTICILLFWIPLWSRLAIFLSFLVFLMVFISFWDVYITIYSISSFVVEFMHYSLTSNSYMAATCKLIIWITRCYSVRKL